MPKTLSIVGQQCMDLYYQEFKSNNDFFDLPDFIDYAGDTVTSYYLQEYRQLRAELRADRQEEIVGFSQAILSQQILEVKECDGWLSAKLQFPYMTFPFDVQATGLQQVLPFSARDCQNLERSNENSLWQFKHVPITDRIFWYPTIDEIRFYRNSIVPLNRIRVLYVPVANPNMNVPDAIVDYVTTNTVTKMKEIEKGTVVKQSLDQNNNKIMETELNKKSLAT